MLEFTIYELAVMDLGLQTVLEDIKDGASDPTIPFTPEARGHMQDMLKNAKSALAKIQQATGVRSDLPPYKPGDENEFLTKES